MRRLKQNNGTHPSGHDKLFRIAANGSCSMSKAFCLVFAIDILTHQLSMEILSQTFGRVAKVTNSPSTKVQTGHSHIPTCKHLLLSADGCGRIA